MSAKKFDPLPAPGDIVFSLFPEIKGIPSAKPRPALVLAIVEFEDGSRGVRVAYGTSKKTSQHHSGEFTITPKDGPAYIHAGLSFPTKFDIGKQQSLPYTEQWFRVPPAQPFGQSPKLGVLHPSLMRRAQAAFNAAHPLVIEDARKGLDDVKAGRVRDADEAIAKLQRRRQSSPSG